MATTPKKTIPIKSATGGKKPGTALMPWEQEMAAAAKKQAAAEKPMGMFKQIAVSGGHMYIDEKAVPGDTIDVVALAATHENQYYDKAYDSSKPAVPICFAFGDQTLDDPEAAMVPHSASERPQGFPLDGDGALDKSSGEPASCANCWANRMGTADVGKGKACKNIRRMILTTEDSLASVEAMKDGEARMFKVPVMSVGNWVNFVHECADEYQRGYWGVVCTVSIVPDKKSQWRVLFAFKELITFDQALYDITKKRVASAAKDILAPYPKLDDEEETGKGKKTAAKKTPGAKPSGPASRAKSKY